MWRLVLLGWTDRCPAMQGRTVTTAHLWWPAWLGSWGWRFAAGAAGGGPLATREARGAAAGELLAGRMRLRNIQADGAAGGGVLRRGRPEFAWRRGRWIGCISRIGRAVLPAAVGFAAAGGGRVGVYAVTLSGGGGLRCC